MDTNRMSSEPPMGWQQMARNHWIRIGLVVVAVLLLIVIVTPFFVNANTFRPVVENKLSSVLGRRVTIGSLSFSVFSGGLVAKNVSIADDPAFSSRPFFQAKSLHIGIGLGALIFHHQLDVRKFVAESPQVQLISGPNGLWNYSSLSSGNSSEPRPGGAQSSAASFKVSEVDIHNGQVTVQHEATLHGAATRPFTYSDVNVMVKNISYTHAMPFLVSAKLPGDGSLSLKGTAGPLNRQNMAATPMQASLEVKNLDPVTAGMLPASEGISMMANATAQVSSDGRTLTSRGNVSAAHLLLSRNGSPTPEPVDLDYTIVEDLQSRAIQIKDLTVHTGSAAAHITGNVELAGPSGTLNLHLSAPQLPIGQLEALLPAVGIQLPKGSQLKGGTLTANLDVTGTTASPVITGPVSIDNTELAGFDLSQKIMGLKALHSLGDGTQIQTVRAHVQHRMAETNLSNIYADVPQIGTANGQGTVSSTGALNFQLTAKFSSTGAVGGVVNGVASVLGNVAGGFLQSKVENQGIPVTITGTSSSPEIRANLGQMFTGGSSSPGQAAPKKKAVKSLLHGLLGH